MLSRAHKHHQALFEFIVVLPVISGTEIQLCQLLQLSTQ